MARKIRPVILKPSVHPANPYDQSNFETVSQEVQRIFNAKLEEEKLYQQAEDHFLSLDEVFPNKKTTV